MTTPKPTHGGHAGRGAASAPMRRTVRGRAVGPPPGSPGRETGEFLRFAGIGVSVGGVVLLLLVVRNHWGILVTAAAFGLLSIGAWVQRYGKQLAMPTAEEVLQRDKRAPVLLLRSFRMDEVRIPVPRASANSIFKSSSGSSVLSAPWWLSALRSTGCARSARLASMRPTTNGKVGSST